MNKAVLNVQEQARRCVALCQVGRWGRACLLALLVCVCAPQVQAGKVGFYAGLDVGATDNDMRAKDFVKILVDWDLFDYTRFVQLVNATFPVVAPVDATDNFTTRHLVRLDAARRRLELPDPNDLTGTYWANLKKPDNSGYTIRAHAGYNWRTFLGFEGALFLNSDVTIRSDDRAVETFFDGLGFADVSCPSSAEFRADPAGTMDVRCMRFEAEAYTRGFEILAKAEMPVGPFSIYGKVGAAYTILEAEGRLVLTEIPNPSSPDDRSRDISQTHAKLKDSLYDIRKVVAAGVAYQASEELVVNAAYYRYASSGYQPAYSALMLSLTVELGGFQRCGEVLC